MCLVLLVSLHCSFLRSRPRSTYVQYRVMLVSMDNRWQRSWRGGTRSSGEQVLICVGVGQRKAYVVVCRWVCIYFP